MPLPERERIATIEAELRGVREDVQALTAETERARQRLHSLEGATRGLSEVNRIERLNATDRDRRLEIRLQTLTVAVAAAALLEPIFYAFVHH